MVANKDPKAALRVAMRPMGDNAILDNLQEHGAISDNTVKWADLSPRDAEAALVWLLKRAASGRG